jgi:Serine dehydrogenase proteinase
MILSNPCRETHKYSLGSLLDVLERTLVSSVWDFVLNEYNALQAAPRPPAAKIFWADLVESKIDRVCHLSGRPLIIYASACTVQVGKVASELLAIDQSDKMGFHSMLEGVTGAELDVLIHSPGGSAEAAETIVEELRRKFPGHVRFIVPSYAKSAATMMVMSGNIILMDEDAELGPIDPQFFTRNGVVPGEAIKQQFEKAAKDILSDPKRAQVWYPIMQMLG